MFLADAVLAEFKALLLIRYAIYSLENTQLGLTLSIEFKNDAIFNISP